MEEDVDTYLALTNPDGSHWLPRLKEHVRMLRMFNIRQPIHLLMTAKRHLSDSDFERLLDAIVVISFRYNVIGNLQPNEQERAYHAEAMRLATQVHTKLHDVLDGLKTVYTHDDVFRTAFAEKTIGTAQNRNRQVVKYILCQLERQKTGADLDFGSDTLSIEHICPTKPQKTWQSFTDEDVETLSDRLGNMTLLQAGQNNDLGNAEYAVKRPVYQKSTYGLTRDIAEHNADWTPERIAARQKSMASMATSIWRIAQLS